MITLDTAESALKTVYLGVIGNQLNLNTHPLLTKIKQTTSNVYGNEIKKVTSYGISGGVTAGSEDGQLPGSYSKHFKNFTLTLKNLYGTIEITDKAIRCSQNSAGAFVNLLNDEMESLIKSSMFNLSRMLYGDGTGILATVPGETQVMDTFVKVDTVKYLTENMAIRFANRNGTAYTQYDTVCIDHIDRKENTFSFGKVVGENIQNYKVATVGGLNNEITGLGAIFNTEGESLYGLERKDNEWLNPYIATEVGEISESAMQEAIDTVEEQSGSEVDFITCSSKVRRMYQEAIGSYRRNIDVMNLQGGFKALSYNGIPVVADRFVDDDEMFLLSSKEFEMYQLCDWQWLEGNDGRIIKQKDGYPVYTATLVKYAELLCNRPNAQAKLKGIAKAE